ncbi:MAG TPA: 3-oxoacyl-ACP reductase FabG [Gaiellales bacterium]|jgi:acetoacetyl-CoA reductase|nr:3-oxoacyl-ACP reductase FabG [Gaiellales bacterium]
MAEMEQLVCVVTGGSRGIGRAVVMRLGAAGCRMVINCRSAVGEAEALAAELEAAGGAAIVVPGSIAEPATGAAVAHAAEERFGRVDVLVNNAGITDDATLRRMTDEQFTEVVQTNLIGTHRVTRAVIDGMCDRGFGRIITVSSFVGQLGNFGQSNYAATKAGLIGWTKTLALEVARHGVTVNCVCPGFIDTDMLRGVPEHVLERLVARIPLGRFGDADEVARGVEYLVRDGGYITGSCLNINGGLYM